MAQLEQNYSAFDYDDVRLLPQKTLIKSRSEADTSVQLGEHIFKIPVVPANMSTIMDESLAEYLAINGYFYVMHRFNIHALNFVKKMHDKDLIASISLGVQKSDYELVDTFIAHNVIPEFITVDVAHGHSDSVGNIVEYIKSKLPETFVIAGNVGTVEGANFLEESGADAVKVGIGPGLVCTTAPNTGFGTRNHQLSSIQNISNNLINDSTLVVADGGIRHYGDIAKSIAFGADLVMVGGMFAGHDESPGEIVLGENDEKFKVYFGSASEHQKGEKKYVEGKRITVPYKGAISETLRTIKENLQSSISYAGGRKLSDLFNVSYVIVNS